MIKYFALENSVLKEQEHFTEKVPWICLEHPTVEEFNFIQNKYTFPKDYITAVLDDTENSRFEKLNQETFAKSALILLQFPLNTLSPTGFLLTETYPFSLILTPDKKLITVSNYEPPFVKKVLQKEFPENANLWDILFQLIWELTFGFNELLATMKKNVATLEKKIQVATENEQLYQIMDIQKSLIYFQEATVDNQQVLENFYKSDLLQLSEKQRGQLHDILVENRQALISSRLQLKLVEKMNETFSSIVSNNLNNVMKILTSLTIVLTIPTIIGGLFGMNVALPFANRQDAFILIFLGTFILCILAVYYLRKNRFL